MKTQSFINQMSFLRANYPSERVCNNVSYCTKQRRVGHFTQNKVKESRAFNMQMIYDCDFARAWLYADLAGEFKSFEQMSSWWVNYLSVDFKNWQASCDAAYEFFRREHVPTMRISEFKAQFRLRTGMSETFLLAPIWSQLECYFLRHEKNAEEWFDLLRKVVQWTRFSRKLRLINTDAEEAAYEKFKANDVRLEHLWAEPDSERDRICKDLNQIITKWLSPFPFQVNFPHHGSGATADETVHKDISLKCLACLKTDESLDFLYRKLQLPSPMESLNLNMSSYRTSIRTARFLTVDKNIDERRGIGPQEASLMWIQQGVRDWFYTGPFSSPFFRRHMPIFDRDVNRNWAVYGSRLNRISTVDLSSASDSVSIHLVKRLFNGNLRYALMLARSKYFSKEPERQFTTYATMGDATTFPVETIIFGAVCQLAINLAVARYRDAWVKLPFDPNAWSVFGDDIVVPNDALVMKYLYWILSVIGFKVNYDKSFVHGPYRESCGIEAYLGEDITPHYFRVKVDTKASRFASFISLANACYWRQLKLVRQWVIYILRNEFGEANLPFTEKPDDNSRLYTRNLRLDNAKTTWNRDIQEVELRTYGLRSPIEACDPSGFTGNYGYYVQSFRDHPDDDPSAFTRSRGFIGYINRLNEEGQSKLCYDERLTKLCKVAVPVRLLVQSTQMRVKT